LWVVVLKQSIPARAIEFTPAQISYVILCFYCVYVVNKCGTQFFVFNTWDHRYIDAT